MRKYEKVLGAAHLVRVERGEALRVAREAPRVRVLRVGLGRLLQDAPRLHHAPHRAGAQLAAVIILKLLLKVLPNICRLSTRNALFSVY